jgi:hypothetical protein
MCSWAVRKSVIACHQETPALRRHRQITLFMKTWEYLWLQQHFFSFLNGLSCPLPVQFKQIEPQHLKFPEHSMCFKEYFPLLPFSDLNATSKLHCHLAWDSINGEQQPSMQNCWHH